MRMPIDIVCDIMQNILLKVSNSREIKNLRAELAPLSVRFDLDGVSYRVSGSLMVEEIQGNLALSSRNAGLLQEVLRSPAQNYEQVGSVINMLVNTSTIEQLREMAIGLGWPDMESKMVLRRIFRVWLEKAVNETEPQQHLCQEALDIVWLYFGAAARQRLATAIGKQFGFDYAKDTDHR